jgi:hypothetical protein
MAKIQPLFQIKRTLILMTPYALAPRPQPIISSSHPSHVTHNSSRVTLQLHLLLALKFSPPLESYKYGDTSNSVPVSQFSDITLSAQLCTRFYLLSGCPPPIKTLLDFAEN